MEGNSHEYPSDEESSLLLSNTAPRRRSSTSRPLNALKRMSSVLTSSRHKEDNKSEESLFTQLDNLADHPQYCSNPAPGLGYKPVKTVTSSKYSLSGPANTDKTVTSSKYSLSEPVNPDNTEPIVGEQIHPVATTSKTSRLSRLSRSNFFGRDTTSASLSSVPENTTPYSASRSRRGTNIPITNLMAPIQPGQEIPRKPMPRSSTTGNIARGMPRSSTTGNLQGTPTFQTPGFMRATSSSAARHNTGIPMPVGITSSRRPSIEHPNAARSTKPKAQLDESRQSLPFQSPVIQPETMSDLPFRRLYGSAISPGMADSEPASHGSHLPIVTGLTGPRRDSVSSAPKPNPHFVPGTLPIFSPSDLPRLMAEYPKHKEAAKHAKLLEFPPAPPPNADKAWYDAHREVYRKFIRGSETDLRRDMESEPELDDHTRVHSEDQRTPTQRNIERGSEQDDLIRYRSNDQQTPTQRGIGSGIEDNAQVQSGRDDERSTRLPDLGDTMDWSASFSDVQRGKQAVKMAISDVDRPKYEAIAKEQESHDSSEGNTVTQGSQHNEEQEEASLHNIYHPMPTAYWSGRFTAASDRMRGEALAAKPKRPDHPMMNDGIRLRRVLKELDQCCQTIEARRSLYAYWKEYASTYGWPRPSQLMSVPQLIVAATGPAPAPEPTQPAEEGSDKKKKKGGVLGRLGSMTFRRKSGN